MTATELREKYLRFFEGKGHHQIPSAPLIPENDPTVLFTTAGMHPLVPFLLGEKHPQGQRLCNSQKCIRTGDIDEVGDSTHLTFFEMLGNWSLGDYFKKEAIEWSFEFLTKELGIPLNKLAFTVFEGDPQNNVPRDQEAANFWQALGAPKEKIAYLGREDNWWGPAGQTGPCGPDTEMFYWTGAGEAPKVFNPSDKQWVEIWNDVFMQYNKTADGRFVELAQKNVDTGMGLERTIAILQGKSNVYETELFEPIIEEVKRQKAKSKITSQNLKVEEEVKAIRIITDHLKAAAFLLADGLAPSNTDRGYILRRLIRRAVRYGKMLCIGKAFTVEIAKVVIGIYQDVYSELKENQDFILTELSAEEDRFSETLNRGLKEFMKFSQDNISGQEAFNLYQSYGFPIEIIKELAGEQEVAVDEAGFQAELKKHQELSRTASSGQFKAGLADNSEQTTKYHTATHLLHQALRAVLGDTVEQRGSNITVERLRFDFLFNRKMTEQEIKTVEDLVNEKIKAALPIECSEMDPQEAKNQGAIGLFGHKYGNKVKVYLIGQEAVCFSKEICGGPHVQNTIELGQFKIIKEEASSQGIRRIKAVLL